MNEYDPNQHALDEEKRRDALAEYILKTFDNRTDRLAFVDRMKARMSPEKAAAFEDDITRRIRRIANDRKEGTE